MRNRLLMMGRKRLVPGYSALYLFDEGSGTLLTDRSGNGNHGTFGAGAAAPTYVPQGLSFDGGDSGGSTSWPASRLQDLVNYLVASHITPVTVSQFHGYVQRGYRW